MPVSGKKALILNILDILRRYVSTRHGGNQRRAAQDLGIKTMTLNNWLKGKRTPNLDALEPVFEALHLHIVSPGDDFSATGYDYVPKHAARAGAGASLETSDEVEGMYAFRKDWLAAQGIYASSAVMLDVTGDSMEPLLREGDTLLIDKRDTEIRDGRIYVVTLGDELRVKRVFHSMNGLILRSENRTYPDVPVAGPDLETFRVHGRVRWCGKML